MNSITAIILTKNEEKNIEKCISSIKKHVERIIVVDSGSLDSTVKLAESMGAEVVLNPFKYYADQFNWAIDNNKITSEWILRIDADEEFTEKLWNEIKLVINERKKDVNGITIEAWLYFMGKKLNYGASKKRKMMLFKNGIGRIEDRKRDAHSIIEEGYSVSMSEKFIHYDFKSLNEFVDRYNYYAKRETEDYIDYISNGKNSELKTDEVIQRTRKKKFGIYYKAPKFLRAWLWFMYNYLYKKGFLDGIEGFLFHFLECYWYRILVDAKILEANLHIKESLKNEKN